MSSIRPLFAITVLFVVGAFLFAKINQGPARSAVSHAADSSGISPLSAAGGGATLAQDTSAAAPAWPPADAKAPAAEDAGSAAPALQVAPATETNAAANAPSAPSNAAKNGMPEVPAIPEMPEYPKTADASAASQAPAAPQIELPKNVPAAHYGDEAAANAAGGPGGLPALPTLPTEAATAPASSTAAPSAPATAPSSAAIGMPATPTGAPSANAVIPLSEDRYGAGAAAAAPASTPAAATAASSDDRYGVGATSLNAPTATASPAPVSPLAGTQPIPAAATGDSFAATWPTIQAALDRHDLKTAHQLLSKWHNNDTLTPVEAQKVESLLAQLAGTVIYSNEHQLEPARVVKPGESLDTIAKEYNVPWQLLAKINGIASASQVQPGQSLKVVRGPFGAVVDLHRCELTLEVDGRYAGTFPISVPPGTQVSEGPWLVDQKDAVASSRSIVLRSAANSAASLAAPKLTITASTTSADAGMPGSEIQVAPQDAEDLSDILSVGSRVVVRR
jgi:LysM repeat protein